MAKDEFEPKLGRIKDQKTKRESRTTKRLTRAAFKVVDPRDKRRKARRSTFTGSRIGRGRAQGSLAAARKPRPGQRRVIVKVRVPKLSKSLSASRVHLSYIQREGVTREGDKGKCYDAFSDDADRKTFHERSKGDRHQFRIIVSPEDGQKLSDLKPFIRDLMSGMEKDLETKLDWIAVDHFNTGHPHTHIILRGKDDKGKDLIMARDYVSYGIRNRAQDLITLELGPESEFERNKRHAQEIDADRFTRLHHELQSLSQDGLFSLHKTQTQNWEQQSLRLKRLKALEGFGLAEEERPGTWRLSANMEHTLRAMGKRSQIIQTMNRELEEVGLNRRPNDLTIFHATPTEPKLVGQVIIHGFADELQDKRYLLIDGLDGRVHYADIGVMPMQEVPKNKTIVALTVRCAKAKAIDKTISDIAAKNSGLYSRDAHTFFDEKASPEFIETHVRRLEALRREGLVERFTNDTWEIGDNYLDMARQYEEMRKARQPLDVKTLSHLPLEKLTDYDGATWLDYEITSKVPEPIRQAHFGADVSDALAKRKQWLMTQGLATESQGQFQPQKGLVETLRRRELIRTGNVLSQEFKLNFTEAKLGEEIHGTYRRSVQLASGKYALIERTQDFTLVPWRSVLERSRGKTVSGIMRARGISWKMARQRGLGIG